MQDEKAALCSCASADACPCYGLIEPKVAYTGGCRRQIQVGEPFHYGTPKQVDCLEAEAFKNADPNVAIFVQRDGADGFMVLIDEVGILTRSADDAQKMAEKVAAAINEHSVQTARLILGDSWPALPDGSEPAAP